MDETKNNDNTMKWIAIGCAAILAVILCCILAGAGGIYWLGTLSTEDKAQIEVTVPIEAASGDVFTFTVAVKNISDEQIIVDSVDIQTTFLDGFIIESVNPTFADTYQFDSLDGTVYQTYEFKQSIEPGQTITFTFKGQAISSGDFSGEIDTCIDSLVNCKTDVVRTIVK